MSERMLYLTPNSQVSLETSLILGTPEMWGIWSLSTSTVFNGRGSKVWRYQVQQKSMSTEQGKRSPCFPSGNTVDYPFLLLFLSFFKYFTSLLILLEFHTMHPNSTHLLLPLQHPSFVLVASGASVYHIVNPSSWPLMATGAKWCQSRTWLL